MQMIRVLIEAVLEDLALGNKVIDRAQRDETESEGNAVGKPGGFDARAETLDEAQALAPRRQLLARAPETHVRGPGSAQQPMAE